MASIKKKLEDHYKIDLHKAKKYCPQTIQLIVDQFVTKGWMNDVEYYYSCACYGTVFVVGKTNMHHDAFYHNPLGELIFALGGHMAPNKHCEFILGLGYIVIEVQHADWLRSDECETTLAGYEPKGIEAFANVFQQTMRKCHQLENKVETLEDKVKSLEDKESAQQ